MAVLKEAVEKHSVLPAFAVTTFKPHKFCIVKPFYESWENLSAIAQEEPISTSLTDAARKLINWLCLFDRRITDEKRILFVVRPADAAADRTVAAAADKAAGGGGDKAGGGGGDKAGGGGDSSSRPAAAEAASAETTVPKAAQVVLVDFWVPDL
eukprot:GHVS01061481.1.p1 GENE.GHVS01061481.1~~GHVS01061481.1.p1  ORF type:complete len:154 (-),score=56.56 GHVS01061481.1:363-824(-)